MMTCITWIMILSMYKVIQSRKRLVLGQAEQVHDEAGHPGDAVHLVCEHLKSSHLHLLLLSEADVGHQVNAGEEAVPADQQHQEEDRPQKFYL